jgi:NADH-quinone oxidoreductase subunit J
MTIPIHQIIFFVFSAILVISAAMVVLSRNPVRAALFLVVCCFASSILWMMLQVEFLALALIFVYVGAVMTLFLFVVMMLNVDLAALKEGFVRWLPLGVILLVALIVIMVMVVGPGQLNDGDMPLKLLPANYSNVKAMGELLYTKYLYPFELAAVILLIAIIAAISLAFFGKKPGTRSQKIGEQHLARKKDRLRVVDMKKQQGDA